MSLAEFLCVPLWYPKASNHLKSSFVTPIDYDEIGFRLHKGFFGGEPGF